MQLLCDSVCALVFQRTTNGTRYLMLRRAPERGGFWQSVSGHVRKGESAEDGARREVREETGFEPGTVIPLDAVNIFFIPREEAVYLEPCFGIEVGGDGPILSAEHVEHDWVEIGAALKLIPFAGVRTALEELDRRLAAAGGSSADA